MSLRTLPTFKIPEPGEPPEFLFIVDSAEAPQCWNPDDQPELTEPPEPPDFQSSDEPMEMVVRADYSDIPKSD
jgi:hypothetical protein